MKSEGTPFIGINLLLFVAFNNNNINSKMVCFHLKNRVLKDQNGHTELQIDKRPS